jgi:TP901 family phage tail tape measure protein
MTVRTVAVALRMEIAGYVAGARGAATATRTLVTELEGSRQASDRLANGLLMVGGVMAGGFLLGVRKAAQFEQAMSGVQSVTKGTAMEMERLRAAALKAGQDTVYTATEAAHAQEELAKAGLSAADILGGALTGALSLAAAGGLDLAEAADVAAKAMSQFGLKGKDVEHVADMLAGGANATATDVHGLALALRMGGGAAHAMGMSLDDTVVTLGALTKGALVGSDAGTSLKTMMMMLARPTEKASALMRELGINAFDASGQFVGVYKLAGILQDKLGTLTQQQRMSALATIFGADAMRAANVLYEQGADGMQRLAGQINDQADAAGTAAIKTDNLIGDFERLKGSLEAMAIESGSGSVSGIRKLVQGLDNAAESFSLIPSGVQSTVFALTGIVGVTGLVAGGLLKARTAMIAFTASMAAAGPVAGKVGAGMLVFSKGLGYSLLAITALQATSAAVGYQISPQIKALSDDLVLFGRTGKFAGEGARIFGENLGHLKYDLSTLDQGGWAKFGNGVAAVAEGISGLGSTFDESLFHARERITGLDTALASLVQQGNVEDAEAAFAKLAEVAKTQGISVDDLKKGLPQYVAALEGANKAQTTAISTTQKNIETVDLLTGSLEDAVSKLGSFKDAFDRFNGGALNVSNTAIAVEQTLDDLAESGKGLKKALNASKTAFDLNTEAGRKAQSMVNAVATEARDAAQAVYEQTGSVNAANDTFNGYKARLIETLHQLGLTTGQAQAMAEAVMAIPKVWSTDYTMTTKYRTEGTPSRGNSRNPGLNSADGNIIQYYADGGISSGSRIAQIAAPRSTMRIWNEPEAEGEVYIPLAVSKRRRSTEILREANRLMGYPIGVQLAAARPASPASAAAPVASSGSGAGVASARAIRAALEGMAVVMDSTVVGRLQGRQADLLRRGG